MKERIVMRDLFGPGQDFSRLDWQPFRAGVEAVRVYGGEPGAPSAALLRYAPGAAIPRHQHTGYEHIIVLQGSQRDEHATYAAGDLLIHASETAHTVASDDGCVVLAIWQSPVRFEDE